MRSGSPFGQADAMLSVMGISLLLCKRTYGQALGGPSAAGCHHFNCPTSLQSPAHHRPAHLPSCSTVTLGCKTLP